MEQTNTAEVAEDIAALWVIVRCNKNLLGFNANLVGNMIALPKITHVPDCVHYMSGTITVRGAVIPLIDLRVFTGQPSAAQEVEEFCALMDQRLADHENWLRELKASVDEEREFTLTTDPHKCAFGQWYESYHTDDRFVAGILRKFEAPHKQIHGIADKVTHLVTDGKVAEAHQLIDTTSNVELRTMIGLFDDIKKAAHEAGRRRIAMVLELGERTLALDIDEVVAVESISNYEPAPQYDTSHLGISRIGRRDKDDSLVLLMEELAF